MNAVSIILLLIIVAALIWAVVRVIKNKGKCRGCTGDCSNCTRKKI